MDELLIYLDGQFVKKSEAKISVFDHGLLYGDGAFEGIRAYNGRVFKLKEHVDRMFQAAKAIMLEMPVSKEELAQVVIDTCKKNNLKDAYIRLVVTRGYGDLGINPNKCPKPTLICIASSIQMYPPEVYEKGMSIITATQRRNRSSNLDPQIKSLNYLNNVLAAIEANQAGVNEALMLTEDGIVAECTGDNVFIVKDGVVTTPPTHVGILDGITRKTIMDLAQDLSIPVKEAEFTLFNVYNADECFITGSGAEALAITEVDGRKIGEGVCGPVTRKLMDAYRACIMSTGEPIV